MNTTQERIMKSASFLILSAMIAVPVLGAKVDRSRLQNGRVFSDKIPPESLISRQLTTDAGEVQINLGFFKEDSTTSAELRLVAHFEGRTKVLWRVVLDNPRDIPDEAMCEVLDGKTVLGLCFLCRDGTALLLYELDMKKAFRCDKGEKDQVLPSSWLYTLESMTPSTTNDLRQLIDLRGVLNVPATDIWRVRNLEMRGEKDRWIFCGVFETRGNEGTQEARVSFQHPVGGKGFSRLMKREGVSRNVECLKKLKLIKAAKEQWAKAENKKQGEPVDIQKVDEYIKDGHPVCPEGGEYVYGALGETPKCTIHGTSE